MGSLVDFAQKLRVNVDIVDLIGEYVQLRRGGANLLGLCPFHNEKTPSFTVSAAKQMFHCFGCKAGGDVVKFVQLRENLEWIDALRFLSAKYGIPMPEPRQGKAGAAERDTRERLLAINKLAANHFAGRLEDALRNPASGIAHYLARRRIDPGIVRNFGLGLAADAWADLLDTGRKAGYEREALAGAGLVIHNTESNRFYDRFRKRLIFPVWDTLGRPIAFGARVYASDAGPEEPKYINSPETAVYHKGHHLYALHLAKEQIAREQRALVMEGYMDVIRAHQHGFTNAVATCGTALTEEQARSLKKLCHEIVFVYDGDEAGKRAMLRGCEILLEHEFSIRVVVLPDNHDPDSFLSEFGTEPFAAQLKGAKDFLGFFLDTAAARFGRNSTDAKIQTVDFVLPLLARVRNPIALHEHVRQASQFVGIDETLILRQLRQKQPRDTAKLREQIQVVDQSGSRLEQILLKTAIESSQAGPKLLAMIEAEWLTDPRVRKWFLLCKSLGMDGNLTWEDLFSRCDGADDDDARFLRGLALHEFEPLDDSDRTLDHLHARLRRGFLLAESRRLSELCHELFPNDPEGKTWRDKIQARDKALPDLKKAINGSLLGSPLRKSNGV